MYVPLSGTGVVAHVQRFEAMSHTRTRHGCTQTDREEPGRTVGRHYWAMEP